MLQVIGLMLIFVGGKRQNLRFARFDIANLFHVY